MGEKTKIQPMPIDKLASGGRDWIWYPDLNLQAVDENLDQAGRERCVDELNAEWRRSMIHVVA